MARTEADRLVAATRRSILRWRSVAAAEADGFQSIGDGITGYEHFVRWDWIADGSVLAPTRPESLVYRVGRRPRLVSAMYILEPGTTMRDVPDLGDRRAVWHRHTNLCWRGRQVVGLFIGGECMPSGRLRGTPPMLHVWVRPHVCGPFAGLELRRENCKEAHNSGH